MATMPPKSNSIVEEMPSPWFYLLVEVTLLPGAAGRPAVDRSRRALQIDLTGGRPAGLAKATARSRRRRSCCRRRTCGGGAACLGAPPRTATARMVRCHQGARAGAAPHGSGFFCTSRSPWCNEHGTIYAISSDFGDRMTTQYLD